MLYQTIVFAPLVGFLIAGLFGRQIGARASELVTTGLLAVSAALSWVVFFSVAGGHDEIAPVDIANWLTSGKLAVAWALRIDTLTAVMLVVVGTVSFVVHLYSIGYMAEDKSRPRFFAYLSLFTFAMLTLVTADNLVQMFFGWEGVGLASYLLIGFWYERPSANAAAIKAFVVNRVGDFGFALGIFLLFALTGSVGLEQIFAAAPGMAGKTIHLWGIDWDALTIVAAWMSAETGVGPSIASGSQVCSRNCADLPIAPMNSNRQVIVSASPSIPKTWIDLPTRLGAAAKICSRLTEPVSWNSRKMPSAKPKSPTRLTTKALIAAALAEGFSYQKPISR